MTAGPGRRGTVKKACGAGSLVALAGVREVTLAATPGLQGSALRPQQGPQIASLGWALRRAALGLVLLLAMVVLGTWLYYAGIDPDEAGAAAQVQATPAAPR